MSEILERWRAGEGLGGVLAIDGHTHVSGWAPVAGLETPDAMAAAAAAAMDAHGVDAVCVMGGGYTRPGEDHVLGNDILLDVWRRLPERVIPFAHVNPNDGRDAILGELRRVRDAGVRGIKLINSYQNYPGDGPNLMAVYEFAAAENMLILNHQWTPEEIGRIAPAFGGVDLIFGHYGAWQDPILKAFPNVYANIWSLGSLGFLERGVRAAGAEKFLMGSDAFINPMAVGIGLVVYADIPDAQKRLILGLNQARLLAKVGALPPSLKSRCG